MIGMIAFLSNILTVARYLVLLAIVAWAVLEIVSRAQGDKRVPQQALAIPPVAFDRLLPREGSDELAVSAN
jgi:hypothetical protein